MRSSGSLAAAVLPWDQTKQEGSRIRLRSKKHNGYGLETVFGTSGLVDVLNSVEELLMFARCSSNIHTECCAL